MDELIRVTWKSVLIFFILIILTRVIGRKLLSQMSFFDYVIGITIGTISGAYVVQMVQGMWVLLSPLILTLLTILFGFINMKSIRLRKLTEGEPVVLIQNGRILDKNLKKLRYHLDDLEMQLRTKDVFNMNDVEFAVLEAHGQLSVLKKSQKLPLTPKDMGIETKYEGMPTEIIKDGEIFEQNLKQSNLSFNWLYQELRKKNILNVEDVFYAALNTDGTLYIDLKEDKMDYVQKVED